mmetsp:Transcript_39001/g.44902  ORF Transcript_39001/g.44902 Transcript_39001/m.44902 type:complete len:202 (+) Transcript_39001:268-873(+)
MEYPYYQSYYGTTSSSSVSATAAALSGGFRLCLDEAIRTDYGHTSTTTPTKNVNEAANDNSNDNDNDNDNSGNNNEHSNSNDTDTDDETCRPYQFQYTRNGDINSTQQEKCRVDFHFLDVVTNIPGAIETIYRHFYPQELLSHDIKQKFTTYLNENHREKYGNQQHRTLEQLSLTKDEVTHQEYNRIFLEPFPEHSNSNNQ